MTTVKKEQSFAKSLGKPKNLGKCVGGQGRVFLPPAHCNLLRNSNSRELIQDEFVLRDSEALCLPDPTGDIFVADVTANTTLVTV